MAMTVGDLKAKLDELDDDRTVVLSSDPEGNKYSPLSDLWSGAYVASSWGGEAYLEELTEEDREAGYTEADVADDGEPALFLVPTN